MPTKEKDVIDESIAQEKIIKEESIKKLVIDIIDRGILDLRHAGLLATLFEMNDQDGKCGCRDVCGCYSGCIC